MQGNIRRSQLSWLQPAENSWMTAGKRSCRLDTYQNTQYRHGESLEGDLNSRPSQTSTVLQRCSELVVDGKISPSSPPHLHSARTESGVRKSPDQRHQPFILQACSRQFKIVGNSRSQSHEVPYSRLSVASIALLIVLFRTSGFGARRWAEKEELHQASWG
ncbi:uncharacterized protein BDV14DRAFT_137339 [Aspergillus stella-maris]|uniref:uncharacterized protein n=1 Tax=Aspergillus stella-maris TaxID=1810926 RepID=UPI003CCDD713